MPDDETQAPEADATTDENDVAQDNKTSAQEAEQSDDQLSGDQEHEQKDDPKKLKAQWEKANREAAGLRKRVKELEPLAQKAKDLEDAQKSEVEKLNDQLATAQVELQGFRVAEIRRSAAEAAGLPAKYMKYITAADEAEALEQAKELAKDIKTPEPKPADLKQGTRPHVPVAETKDSLIRRMAGYEVG
jgi:DNA repair exonuclease SbcCD ATPase subunit